MHVISASPCPQTDDAQYRRPSNWVVLRAWLMLLYVEFIMHIGGLNAVRRLVQKHAVYPTTTQQVTSLCRAVDLACVFYFKRILCLQRSAATVMLLRRYGWGAAMVIGVQMLPFQSHAWVEIQGAVINDKPYVHDIYRVLERC
jgi:transglutaminase superfamily protein